jgi:YYY domain-containing protein
MTAFISWYILITFLGWLTFPLAYRLFPALADRGYTLSRAFGLLVWGFVFWLFANFGIAQNDMGGLFLGLVILGGLSAWGFFDHRSSVENRKSETLAPGAGAGVADWLKENKKLVITTEILFLLAFGFMAFVRANNPEITTAGGEKWMEVAFINAILGSPVFPPHDPWLSGYAISYYHFGYIMTAMLAKFTSTPAPVAHNLMLSLIFALSSIGAYGILYNLLAFRQTSKFEEPALSESKVQSEIENHKQLHLAQVRVSPIGSSLLAPLFLLIISNLEGLLQSLHDAGFFWQFSPDGTATSRFWTWLDIPDLKNIPTQPLTLIPDKFYWWWRASRVVQDYELNGVWHEVIDEFPFFSYLLGDLHPHVLAMPFMLLAVAIALNIYQGGWHGRINLFVGKLHISKTGFFVSALVLGGLAFLNTWDILPGAALIVFSYALARVRESGWGWERTEDVFSFGIPVMITAYVMYLPFFVGFDSQAGGIVPSFMFPTRGAQLWVMWGVLFIPLFAYLIYLWRRGTPADWRAGTYATLGLVLGLLALMFVFGFMALKIQPALINSILDTQGRNVNAFIADSMKRRLSYIGSLLTLMALLIPTLSFLFSKREQEADGNGTINGQPSTVFVLLLIALGVLLILGPDFFYLRDNFGYRINTVFKFYYQAWQLLSVAAAFGVAVLFAELRGVASKFFAILMVVVTAAGLAYPVFSLPTKTNDFKVDNPEQRTLDGSAYLATYMSDDYQAIQFMKQLEPGVVAEAVGGQYSEYARISTYTGLPTVLGWPGHEAQWRDGALLGSRESDIETLYSTPDWVTTKSIIDRYNIRYIYVGGLERGKYRVNEEKFNKVLKPIYRQGNVIIYEVP